MVSVDAGNRIEAIEGTRKDEMARERKRSRKFRYQSEMVDFEQRPPETEQNIQKMEI